MLKLMILCLQACLIGFVSTGITCPAENLLSYWLRTDGMMDIDCLCYTRGCEDNPGSLGISLTNHAPGDATIPGRTKLSGDCGQLGLLHDPDPDPCERVDAFTAAAMTTVAVGMNGTTTEICKMGDRGLLDSTCPCDLSLLWSGGDHGCNTTCLRECGFTPAWGPALGTESSDFWQEVVPEGVGPFEPAGCWSSQQSLFWFWSPLLTLIIVCAGIEVACLMYYGVMHSIRVAWALGYRLVPLNEDRAFLADSLVRGAFECDLYGFSLFYDCFTTVLRLFGD